MQQDIKSQFGIEIVKPDDIQLDAGELGAILECIVTDKDGKVVQRIRKKSESFVAQFLKGLWTSMDYQYPAEYINPPKITDVYGAIKTVYSNLGNWLCNAATGVNYHGTVIGTGTNAPNINDYWLQTPIAHGVGAGQLQFSVVSFGYPTSDGATAEFSITRSFANGSGGTITVREIGLVNIFYDWFSGGTAYYFLTIRDAINIAVLTTQTLTINYLIRATV